MFDWTNQGVSTSKDNGFLKESKYIEVVQLLLQTESDILEDCSTFSYYYLAFYLRYKVLQAGKQERLMTTRLPYWQRLKECGFRFDPEILDTVAAAFFAQIISCDSQVSADSISTFLQLLLDVGLEICAMDFVGFRALHLLLSSKKLESRRLLENATAFLQNGADPCALDDWGMSPCDWAESYGWTAEWFEALERAGYDVDEVEEETERRQWIFHHPGDAFVSGRSGIDEDLVASPSREGLVLRRAVAGDRLDE